MNEQGRERPRGLSLSPLLLVLVLAVGPMMLTMARPASRTAPDNVTPQRHGAQVVMARSTPLGGPDFFPVHPPRSDRPVIWFEATAEQVAGTVRLHALDWDGQDAGSLEVPCGTPCVIEPSPDGRRLLVGDRKGPGQEVSAATVFDSSGLRLSRLDGSGGRWATDSRHLCALHDLGEGSIRSGPRVALEILDSNDGSGRLAATVDAPPETRPTWWSLLNCSPDTDRAVLAVNDSAGAEELEAVEISSGRRLSTSASPGAADPAIQGVSWNGRRALTDQGVVNRATGLVLWRGPPAWVIRMAAAQPGGDDLLLLASPPPGDAGSRVIVRGDGHETVLPLSDQWPFAELLTSR